MIMIAFFREKIGDDNTGKSLSGALLFAEHGEDMLCSLHQLFEMSETISEQNMLSPGLSLEFSCIELVIQ